MWAVEGRGALVALDGVLFFGGDVVRVAVGGAAEDDDGVWGVRVCGEEGRRGGGYGVLPPAAGHGAGLAWADDYEKLADAESLYVDDVGGPVVGGVNLAYIEEDGFGVVAGALLRGCVLEEARDDLPDGGCCVFVARVLGEVEGARAVRGPGGEGVAERGRACEGRGAIGQNEGEAGHVVELVE